MATDIDLHLGRRLRRRRSLLLEFLGFGPGE